MEPTCCSSFGHITQASAAPFGSTAIVQVKGTVWHWPATSYVHAAWA